MNPVLSQLLILCAASIVFVPIFIRLKLGSILAYLFAGVLVGPMVLGWIKDPSAILHFSEFGVVFLLFIIGLELAPAKLWKLKESIFGFGLLQVLLTGALFMLIGCLLGMPISGAFVAGFGLSLSSTAFAVQLLESSRQLNTRHGQGAFAVLMFQDMAVVPILVVVSMISEGGSSSFTLVSVLKVIGVLIGTVLVGTYAIRHIFRFIAEAKIHEVFIAMAFVVVLGTAVLFEAIGLSMGMGAFIAGVLLANSEYRHELEANLTPFKGLLLGLFFIAVGMMLDVHVVLDRPALIVAVTLGFMVIKGIIVFALGRLFRFNQDAAKNIAFSIAQGGEFAFVLFSIGLSRNLLSHEHAAILNAAVTMSMVLTPFVFAINQRFLRKSSELSERPYDEIADQSSEVIIAGFGRFGQIVARFLKSEGITFTILEHDAGQVETARKFGNKVYYGDASRIDILTSSGTAKAKFFILAVDDIDKSIDIAQKVKKGFPSVELIARARNRQHAIALMQIGAKSIHRETYLTSLEVAKEVAVKKGANPVHVQRRMEMFKFHDEKILKEQFEHRNDEKKFVSYTTRANAELEQILRADRDQDGKPTQV